MTQRHSTPHTLKVSKSASWQTAFAWKTRQDRAVLFAQQLAEANLLGPLGLAETAKSQLGVTKRR